jgi:uridylate kinase
MIKYKRILLKLSGEALMGQQGHGIDTKRLSEYCHQIKETASLGVQIGIVIGGGNIFRGLKGVDKGFDRVKGDYMGMLATVINGLAIQSMLENIGVKAKVFTAFRMEPVGEGYSKQKAIEVMESGNVIILTAGTGNPYFTTDTASALRAVELEAELMLKGTRVDGVYTADPEKDPSATKYDELTFTEAYDKGLNIMDLTAFTLCSENKLPVVVFDMNKTGNLKKIILGEKIGTLVKN